MTRCPNCGAEIDPNWPNPHYVPSVGHDTPPEDAQPPHYTCRSTR